MAVDQSSDHHSLHLTILSYLCRPLTVLSPRLLQQPQKRKEALDAQAASSERRPKRSRVPTQPFQSPVPEFEAIPKALKPTPSKQPEERLVIFFK